MCKNRKITKPILAVIIVAIFLLASCGGPTAPGGENVTISVSGAFALYPMMTVWADEYSQINPSVTFDVQAGGAGKGMTDVLAGAVDIAMLSREARPEELEQGAFLVPVAIDAVVPTVNANNPALDDLLRTGLTVDMGYRLWIEGAAMTWGDVVGSDDTNPVNVYTRSDSCGAAEVWSLYLGGASQEDLQGTAVNADPGLAEAVRQDPLAIGFNNVAFAYDPDTGEQVEGLRVVPLDLNSDGQITPDEDFYAAHEGVTQAIAARIYPYPPARVLYLVTKNEPSAAEAAFFRWVLTDGQALIPDAGYVSLDEATIQEGLTSLGG